MFALVSLGRSVPGLLRFTPPANRGVLPTSAIFWGEIVQNSNFLLYDYFTCTLSFSSDYFGFLTSGLDDSAALDSVFSFVEYGEPFKSLLGLSSFSVSVSSGVRGYQYTLTIDGAPGIFIRVPQKTMKRPHLVLEITGSGCRAFETYGNGDYDGLFSFAEKYCHVTRLDVAYDDHAGILDMDTLLFDYYVKKSFVSKANYHQVDISWNDSDCVSDGCTLYCGSFKSPFMVRIYDKAAERGFTDGDHWIRVELQMRDERASDFLFKLSGDLGEKFSGVLLNSLRFVEPSAGDSNRWRWPVKRYWADLVSSASPLKWPKKPGVLYNLGRVDSWIRSQVAPSLWVWLSVFSASDLEALVSDPVQLARLSPKHLKAAFVGISQEIAKLDLDIEKAEKSCDSRLASRLRASPDYRRLVDALKNPLFDSVR